MGSPPPEGSKKEVLKLRSVSSIVIAPARTGKERSKRIAVINTAHTNKGIESKDIFFWCILRIVEIKLIAPKIEDTPAKWREKIVRSIELLVWNVEEDKGG